MSRRFPDILREWQEPTGPKYHASTHGLTQSKDIGSPKAHVDTTLVRGRLTEAEDLQIRSIQKGPENEHSLN